VKQTKKPMTHAAVLPMMVWNLQKLVCRFHIQQKRFGL